MSVFKNNGRVAKITVRDMFIELFNSLYFDIKTKNIIDCNIVDELNEIARHLNFLSINNNVSLKMSKYSMFMESYNVLVIIILEKLAIKMEEGYSVIADYKLEQNLVLKTFTFKIIEYTDIEIIREIIHQYINVSEVNKAKTYKTKISKELSLVMFSNAMIYLDKKSILKLRGTSKTIVKSKVFRDYFISNLKNITYSDDEFSVGFIKMNSMLFTRLYSINYNGYSEKKKDGILNSLFKYLSNGKSKNIDLEISEEFYDSFFRVILNRSEPFKMLNNEFKKTQKNMSLNDKITNIIDKNIFNIKEFQTIHIWEMIRTFRIEMHNGKEKPKK